MDVRMRRTVGFAVPGEEVISWLMAGDPSVRWQVMEGVLGSPLDEVRRERQRVAGEGIGARLLAAQGEDGRWGGTAWNRGWDSTMHVLMLLRDMGLEPTSAAAQRAVGRVREQVTWKGCAPSEVEDNPFFAGEVEPCINGQVAAVGAYFGEDVSALVDRLLGEQLPDGGWNCDAAEGSTRASFNTTICVLEALLQYEQAGAQPFERRTALVAARQRGEEYLLARQLFRKRSTGEPIVRDRKGGGDWTRFAFPTWWHYDVLRGLDYLRSAGSAPDARIEEALALVASRREADGRWRLDVQYPGPMPVDLGETVGAPSRWITLRALRVLAWAGVSEGSRVRPSYRDRA